MELSPLGTLAGLPTFGAASLEGLDATRIQPGQRVPGISNRQFVQFYNKTESQVVATKVHKNERTGEVIVLESKAVPVTREFVKVITPGDTNEVDQPAEEYHKREYFRHYAAFRDGKGVPMGQPIEDCNYIGPGVISELRYRGVHTEEQLADASEILCNGLPNGFSMREFARAACAARESNKVSPQLTALGIQLEQSQKKIAELEALIRGGNSGNSGNSVNSNPAGEILTTEAVKRGPGRPRGSGSIEAA